MELIKNLEWRYATKKFDASKKISAEHLEKIKEAVRLSASSYGLQLYKVLIIEDAEVREKLKAASWGQTQITDASQVVVFCNYNEVQDAHLDDYLQRKATSVGMKVEDLKGYADFMKGKLGEKTTQEIQEWTARQTYIALGNLLAATAELNIDACPMEGFEPADYDKILGLSDQGLSAAVVATIGYRSAEDQTQHAPKVRKETNELFEVI
ncbi:NAD(P)H-dependent oxidoreductase [Microscilla marina]|uniref:NAD(P)H-flavin oxidoreductase n=1 Tax=Microscilla marina ATCC 23134 TaxID=313606 RepID=A1ZFW2_MICM2|nr:NAD(P)H-dependent oxidoreductase [Microscilla marina]EAY30886.1 NAD(P)H-flavin oxidoreductase [Microscilla marina ATCC 23134]